MPFKYAYVLPILCLVWFAATFVITYLISVYREDVVAVFPYISDTGTWSPESCFFGLMLNIGALIQGLIVYLRFRQIHYLADKESFKPNIQKVNRIALVLGVIAAFGVCIVGNFQETNALEIHVGGAIVAFGLGSVYLCMQTYISFNIYPIFGDKRINIVRLVCSIICCVTFFVTFIFAGLSLLFFTGEDITKWKEDDGGYVFHFISAVSEWILALTTIFFLFLFTWEFKRLTISQPLISERTETP